MVKLTGFEAPPLGAGLVTVTAAILAVVMAAAGIAAVNCEGLTNVVARATPAKFTTEPVKKFEPFTVRVKAAPPLSALFGEMVVIAGMGLVTLTAANAAAAAFTTEVALTVTVGGLGTLAGAVYFPVASIVPQLAPAQPVSDRLQVTAWLAPLGLTVAVNCCTPPV